MAPAADDASVPPDRRAGVAVRVEQDPACSPRVPAALLPAHRRRVERRQQRRGRLRPRVRLEVAVEDVANGAVEVDERMRDRSERRARLARRPAVHQRMSVSVAGPNAASQRRSSSACALATSSSSIGPPSQSSVVTQRNCGLITSRAAGRGRAVPPSRAGAGPARRGALLDDPLPALEAELLRQQRHVGDDLARQAPRRAPPRPHGRRSRRGRARHRGGRRRRCPGRSPRAVSAATPRPPASRPRRRPG